MADPPIVERPVDRLVCPITGERMREPLVDPEGNSYEKEAILEWLQRSSTSPLTRTPLTADQLAPNRALIYLLEAEDAAAAAPAPEAAAPDPPPPPPAPLPPLPAVEVSVRVDAATGRAWVRVAVDGDAEEGRAEGHPRAPAAVVFVIDVSGSMAGEATTATQEEGCAALTILDIVKHATRAVMEAMGPDDVLGVVAYSGEARVVLPLTRMTPANRAEAWKRVDELRATGGTNMWDGMQAAMDLVRGGGPHPVAHSHILLLTDGAPNVEPPRGHIPTLRKYREDYGLPCEMSTFGFGYSLDSKLLHAIAEETGGTYSFIPDASFVGTCFVNAAANLLATAVPSAVLSIEPTGGAKIRGLIGGVKGDVASWGWSISLPALCYGQSRDLVVELEEGGGVRATVKYGDATRVEAESQGCDEAEARALDAHAWRYGLADLVRPMGDYGPMEEAQAKVAALIEGIATSRSALEGDPAIIALLEDVKGQVAEAVSREDWYRRWGRHYLPSLSRAHALQTCTNFKDPGLDKYGGALFRAVRDKAEGLFLRLPAPVPSGGRFSAGAGAGSRTPTSVVDMHAFHNRDNPCFAAGPVALADGTTKDVRDVEAGDVLLRPGGGRAAVVCVVETELAGGASELVRLPGGAVATPWHPVRVLGEEWAFPVDLAGVRLLPYSHVYSFVLEGGASTMLIGGHECVTLGHGLVGPVVSHLYLGTTRVLEDLATMDGWRNGRVLLPPGAAVRDPSTGLIAGFRQARGGGGAPPPPVGPAHWRAAEPPVGMGLAV